MTDNYSSTKELIYRIECHNWGERTKDAWAIKRWLIYDDLSVDFSIADAYHKEIEKYTLYLSNSDLKDINDNVEKARFNAMKVDAYDGEAWAFAKYKDKKITWDRPIGYIYGIDPLERISKGLLDLAYAGKKYNIKEEHNNVQFVYGPPDFFRKLDLYNVKPDENVAQRVYGVPSPANKKYDIKPEDNYPQEVYGIAKPPVNSNHFRIEKLPTSEFDNSETITINIKNPKKNSWFYIKYDPRVGATLYVGDNISKKDSEFALFPATFYFDFKRKLRKFIDTLDSHYYFGDKDVKWSIEIKNNIKIQYISEGSIPKDWNDFIDILEDYEKKYNKVRI